MDKDFETLFSRLKPPEPPDDLLPKILNRIQREKRLITIKRRIAIFSLGVLGSAVAFAPAFSALQAGISQSGFADFFSLIFSDFGTIINLWDKFALSLLESLPVLNITLLFTIIFTFLGSLKYLVKNIMSLFAIPQSVTN